jgi:hypothetical protein
MGTVEEIGMKSFEDRKRGFEATFSRDQEKAFRITARRNKIFGLAVAERLGLKAEAAEAYAKTMVAADLEAPGDADIILKARGDLAGRGMIVGETELRSELTRAAAAAGAQLSDGPEAA